MGTGKHSKNSKRIEKKTDARREVVNKTKQATNERKKKSAKHLKRKKLKLLLAILVVLFVVSTAYIGKNYLDGYIKNKEMEDLLNKDISDKIATQEEIVENERIEQVKELQTEYPEIVAWIEIADTNINYPIMQGTDNSFYLTHDYKKEYSAYGSLFLDTQYDFSIPSSNLLIYGHRNVNGLMFEDLIKFAKQDFYESHQTIRFTTNEEDATYEIISVFYSRVYYKSEKNVFRYYYFVNAENEEEYNNYVKEAKKASIYDTGRTAQYGEQLLTLSTCEYSQEDGRFVVVAKKVSER